MQRCENGTKTHSTVDDDSYWTELAQVCHAEHDKYGAGGKVIEAREWIIALDESLLELEPDMVIRQFVDAFHDKYGVECKQQTISEPAKQKKRSERTDR